MVTQLKLKHDIRNSCREPVSTARQRNERAACMITMALFVGMGA